MTQAMGSKEAAAYLIDPMNDPEPSAETGPGTHFGSTFAPAPAQKTSSPTTPPRTSLSSNNPFRDSTEKRRSPKASPNGKNVASASERPISQRSSPRERFPDYRAEAFSDYKESPRRRSQPPPSYDDATASASNSTAHRHRRRTSSLKERYPGDRSHEPLEILRRDSKKAYRSPHLRKNHIPGPDTIDRLDPAIAGRAYHHEGPYDAALLARNTSYENSPLAALKTSNDEALKATPQESIKDAVERHKPLDGVASVPPGMPDRFGRTYNYEEGADLMHEENNDGPGYKRWAGKDYSPDDLKGESEPAFSLDRALRAHKISDSGIELQEGTHLMKDYSKKKENGTLDNRDPVHIAGDDAKYADMQFANSHDTDAGVRRSGSLREGLKKRIGSLRKKRADS
ncbi:hypothetical protein M409DRAFT_68224 [Zasmidium cellare ATCC 36951]|uniref:Pal1 cell morphology protein n=1 Tax=Zasmidium cellare ATCC 36951 TaxID=1080233 RepID=A0A6A6CCU0_ZASCE|nr:uncharacterized protein M409DRAFT_68224 [Zasmidium cellare ATCC 36951]KAF2163998.1 hypothetical protein M409DRAFT_68224 [Zasmidium cellare ATCC 36951]